MNISIVGTGRAGTSFATALRACGHDVHTRSTTTDASSLGTPDLVLLCVPDDEIAERRRSRSRCDDRRDRPRRRFAHTRRPRAASSRRVDASPHGAAVARSRCRATASARRTASRVTTLVRDVVASLGGRVDHPRDDQRTLYHATAVVASNHLVALLGHVRALAESIGLTLEDFLPLAQQSLRRRRATRTRRRA